PDKVAKSECQVKHERTLYQTEYLQSKHCGQRADQIERKASGGDAPFRDDDSRLAGIGRMAPAERNPTRGDGVDGRVLETGVEHFGTRRIRIAVGERARSQGGTWTQNGSKGQPVDRRFAQAWIAAKQFCAAASNPGFAGFDTDPGDPDARAHFDLQPDSEGPGR